jgi:cell wall-associated NlpC family hydrolase
MSTLSDIAMDAAWIGGITTAIVAVPAVPILTILAGRAIMAKGEAEKAKARTEFKAQLSATVARIGDALAALAVANPVTAAFASMATQRLEQAKTEFAENIAKVGGTPEAFVASIVARAQVALPAAAITAAEAAAHSYTIAPQVDVAAAASALATLHDVVAVPATPAGAIS